MKNEVYKPVDGVFDTLKAKPPIGMVVVGAYGDGTAKVYFTGNDWLNKEGKPVDAPEFWRVDR